MEQSNNGERFDLQSAFNKIPGFIQSKHFRTKHDLYISNEIIFVFKSRKSTRYTLR